MDDYAQKIRELIEELIGRDFDLNVNQKLHESQLLDDMDFIDISNEIQIDFGVEILDEDLRQLSLDGIGQRVLKAKVA